MNLEAKKQHCIKIIDTLDNIFILDSSTKNEMFKKMMTLDESEIKNIIIMLVEHMKKMETHNKNYLLQIKRKKNDIDELMDDKKDGKYSPINI